MAGSELRYAYGIFQGGGARGVSHIGALKAAEELNIRFLGIAGASAGAIIAALASVGYTAGELFDPAEPDAFLSAIVDAIGRSDWKRLKKLKGWFDRVRSKNVLKRSSTWPFFMMSFFRTFRHYEHRGGILNSEKLVDHVDKLLRERLTLNYDAAQKKGHNFPDRPTGRVRFREVNRFTPNCTPLKIVVTDLAKNRVVVFSSTDTPEVIVAEAVAASAAFPFMFAPVKIAWPDSDETARIYADGGIASNLPVWVFRDEKFADTRVFGYTIPTIGFGFEETQSAAAAATRDFTFLEYTSRLVQSSLSTGQSVVTSFVDDLEIVAMPTNLALASFEEPPDVYRTAYEQARARAYSQLKYHFERRPKAIAAILKRFKDAAESALTGALPTGARLRVCAVEPVYSRYRKAPILNFRVVQSLGFEADADDKLVLDADNPAAPRAFRERKPIIWSRPSTPALEGEAKSRFMTKYEHALLPSGLQSMLCLPVFDDISNWGRPRAAERAQPLGVVVVDVVAPSTSDVRNLFRATSFIDRMIRETSGFSKVFLKDWRKADG